MIDTTFTIGANPYQQQITTGFTVAAPAISAPASPAPAKTADTTADATNHTATTATAFANNIALRLTQQADTTTESGTEEGTADVSGLAASLKESIQFIGDKFGADAATAAMGIIYKRVGNDEITEDNLSEGLLDVLRFVDRNFGFEGGDALIDHFNGALNNSLNEYFDNGLTEQFYAATPETSTVVQAVPELVQTIQDSLGDDAAGIVSSILQGSLENGPNIVNLRKGLAKAKNALNKEIAPGSAAALAHAAKDVLAGLGEQSGPQQQLKGVALNKAV